MAKVCLVFKREMGGIMTHFRHSYCPGAENPPEVLVEVARRPYPNTGEFLSVSAFTTIHGSERHFEPKKEKLAFSIILEKEGKWKGEGWAEQGGQRDRWGRTNLSWLQTPAVSARASKADTPEKGMLLCAMAWMSEMGRMMFYTTQTSSGIENGWFGCC